MPEDWRRKVFSGVRKPGFPAGAFNSIIDSDAAIRAQKMRRGPPDPHGAHQQQTGMVRIVNDSGEPREALDVLGITGAFYDPDAQPDQFKYNGPIALRGTIPTLAPGSSSSSGSSGSMPPAASHRENYVVLAEPVDVDGVARAYIAGVCPARLNVVSEGHTHAGIKDGDATTLETGGAGTARIVWKQPGTGAGKLAYVELGAAPPPVMAALVVEYVPDSDWIQATPIVSTNDLTPTAEAGTLRVIINAWTLSFRPYATHGLYLPADTAIHYLPLPPGSSAGAAIDSDPPAQTFGILLGLPVRQITCAAPVP